MTNRQAFRTSNRMFLLASAAAASMLLAGCFGDDKDKAAGATQAAARVNDGEITVHQINMVLERQPGLTAEQTEGAAKQVLENLIDQELAVQKAEETKLDRDPKVVQLLDATRKAVLARQYYDKASSAGITPNLPSDIKNYFDENPGLFSNRRTYMLQEFSIQADEAQAKDLQEKLSATSNAKDFIEVVKASGLKASVNQATQPAESLPIQLVGRISALSDGQAIYESVPGGLKAILVVASRSDPLTLEQAKPLIERFLTETKRNAWLKTHAKELRTAAKVEYMGKFNAKDAAGAASAPAGGSSGAAAAAALGG
jgi:EpsD family peptidyl-prolyl cis-trans isomerase